VVDLSAYLDPDDDEPPGGDDGADLAALKTCLKALADALASTNLAVLTSLHGDAPGATRRVQTSVEALKRFTDAFAVLESESADEAEAEGELQDD
jgi:hypothetical protein